MAPDAPNVCTVCACSANTTYWPTHSFLSELVLPIVLMFFGD